MSHTISLLHPKLPELLARSYAQDVNMDPRFKTFRIYSSDLLFFPCFRCQRWFGITRFSYLSTVLPTKKPTMHFKTDGRLNFVSYLTGVSHPITFQITFNFTAMVKVFRKSRIKLNWVKYNRKYRLRRLIFKKPLKNTLNWDFSKITLTTVH